MKILTLFALVLSLGISIGFGEVYPGLKVKGDFRKIQLVVEDINPNKFLTHEDIVNTVKLRLFSNNIKTQDWGTEYLYVNVTVLPVNSDLNLVYSVDVMMLKRSEFYGVSKSVAGAGFTPHQGIYRFTGICHSKDKLLTVVKEQIDRFLVDYIESNMEN